MNTQTIRHLTSLELKQEADNGARYVQYVFVISFLVGTIRKKSAVFLLRPGERAFRQSWPYSLLTLLFGWWALPKGPRRTLQALRTNFHAGVDVTREVTATAEGYILYREFEESRRAI